MDEPDTQSQPAEPQKSAEKRLTSQNYAGLIEQRIAQALSEGQFDNLPGTGRPQRLDDDALVPEEDRAGYRLLKSNGFAPAWIEMRQDLDTQRSKLDAWVADLDALWPKLDQSTRTSFRKEHRRRLEELQRHILAYNLRLPAGIKHMSGLSMAAELAKLGREAK